MTTNIVHKVQTSVTYSNKGRRITLVTGLLLALLGVKLVGSLFIAVFDPFFLIETGICIAAIIGISLKARWGCLLVLAYSSVGLVIALGFVIDFLLVFDYHIFDIHIYYDGIILVIGNIFNYLILIGLAWRESHNLQRYTRILR